MAVQYMANNEPDVSARKGDYRFTLYRSSAPHGGILILTFAPSGQSPSTTAHMWEEYRDAFHRSYQSANGAPSDELNGMMECVRKLESEVYRINQEAA